MNYIQNHLYETITLEAVAESAFFSKYYFHRLFHAVVGETVSAYIRRLRLEKSAGLLRYYPNKDITAIAHELGFSSSQNYSKMFRKVFEVTPTQYRAGCAESEKRYTQADNASPAAGGNADTYRLWSGGLARQEPAMDIRIEEMPACHVAYVRAMGAYRQQRQGAAISWLVRWAASRGIATSSVNLGIFLDNPEITSPEKCRYDACLAVPPGTKAAGEVGVQDLAAGTYAVYRNRRKTARYGRDWEDMLARWLPASGYEPDDRPNYEVVRQWGDATPEAALLVDICLPIKPL